jgi:hypothetical protein
VEIVNHNAVHQEDKIREWMQHVLATGGIERADDLHIDDIDPGWAEQNQWVEGMKQSLRIARPIRSKLAPEKVLALVCSLEDGPREAPLNLDKLAAQFDWSPPSLYLFHLGKEPWKNADSTSKFTRLPLDGFQGLDLSELFLQEWSRDDGLYRSFFGVQ